MANYLTFTSPNSFTLKTSEGIKRWDGILEYSIDTNTWNVWNGSTTLSADGGKLYLRGTGNTRIAGGEQHRWELSGLNIECNGNIETLLDYATVANGEHPIMGDYCYGHMFDGCNALITAPKLPATTLATACYTSMFTLSGLITAPDLPATILTPRCYSSMFSYCTRMINTPELPAMTLATNCYAGMFHGCFDLTTPPTLPATTLAEGCYMSMFFGCNLSTIPKLPATTLKAQCYERMFHICKQLKLSTSPTEEYCNEYKIPIDGNGIQEADNALTDMFETTGGTFTGTPEINTVYYTSNKIVPEDTFITSITYDDKPIAILKAGQEATIKTAECEVEHDIIVSTKDIAFQKKIVTENGSIIPDEGYDGLSKIIIGVAPKLQEKTATASGVILPDYGYYGLSKVTTNVFVPESYKGTITVARTTSKANTESEGD